MVGNTQRERIIQTLNDLGLNAAKVALTGMEDLALEGNKWGSSQYAGAYSMYLLLHIMYKARIPLEHASIKITLPSANSAPKALNVWKKIMIEHERRVNDDSTEPEGIYRKIMKVKNFDQAFALMRSISMDLWLAAEYAFEAVFPRAKITVPKARGFGPKYNILSQQKNNVTGLQCFALRAFGYVKKEKSFADFDT